MSKSMIEILKELYADDFFGVESTSYDKWSTGVRHPLPIDIPKSCECGSEKVGSPRHSDWCPCYIKEE